jgi:hypothetical protein
MYGPQIGDVVEVWNKGGPDKWYMRITKGTVAGEADDPYRVGGQWLQANQTVLIEKPIKTNIHRSHQNHPQFCEVGVSFLNPTTIQPFFHLFIYI